MILALHLHFYSTKREGFAGHACHGTGDVLLLAFAFVSPAAEGLKGQGALRKTMVRQGRDIPARTIIDGGQSKRREDQGNQEKAGGAHTEKSHRKENITE